MSSVNDAKNQAREYMKLTQTNKVELAGTVVSNYVSEAKPRMKDGVQMVDSQNNPLFYEPRMSCKVAFVGGEIEIPLSKDQYDKVKIGEMYLFVGRLGLVKSFGSESISYVFNTIEEL